jgi:hypothetical protein
MQGPPLWLLVSSVLDEHRQLRLSLLGLACFHG